MYFYVKTDNKIAILFYENGKLKMETICVNEESVQKQIKCFREKEVIEENKIECLI